MVQRLSYLRDVFSSYYPSLRSIGCARWEALFLACRETWRAHKSVEFVDA